MKIIDGVYIVGGGIHGIGISNELDCTVYAVDGGDEIMLVDAGVGVETDRILRNIEKEGLDPAKVRKLVLTHGHLDHSGGSAFIKKALGAELYVSEIEGPYLDKGDEDAIGLTVARQAGVYPENFFLTPAVVDHYLKDDDRITVGKYTVKAISTPGHSKGSISFFLETPEKKVLFSGDTVFLEGTLGLLNLPDSSLTDYKEGVGNLSDLDIDCLLPSHGGFTVGNGQTHIDMAIEALAGLSVPRMFI